MKPDVLFAADVLEVIREHAGGSLEREICGVLIGRKMEGGGTEVTACIEGAGAREAGAEVTFTHETWKHIYKIKDAQFPDALMVGWYHSHPGFGIFLSEMDLFIHRNFFQGAHQVAWVVDPQSGEEGCFGWVDGEVARLDSWRVAEDEDGTDVTFVEAEREAVAVRPVLRWLGRWWLALWWAVVGLGVVILVFFSR